MQLCNWTCLLFFLDRSPIGFGRRMKQICAHFCVCGRARERERERERGFMTSVWITYWSLTLMRGQDPYITPLGQTSVIYTFILILSDTDNLSFSFHCSHSLSLSLTSVCVCVCVGVCVCVCTCVWAWACVCMCECVCSQSVLQACSPQGSLSPCLRVKWRRVLLASRLAKCTVNGSHIHIKRRRVDANCAGGGEF